MFPHRYLPCLTLRVEMCDQRSQCFGHVLIPQVPGLDSTAKHRAVISFGIEDKPRVLFGKEEFILRYSPIATGTVRCLTSQLYKLLDYFALTRFSQSKACRIAIGLCVFGEMLEARIAITGTLGGHRIDLVQIAKHCLDRRVQAVKIKTIA